MGCYGVKNFYFKFLPVYHLVCTKQSITMNIVIFFFFIVLPFLHFFIFESEVNIL